MITPTVGRVVHYRATPWDWEGAAVPMSRPQSLDQPLAAIITRVYADDCVNLVVFEEGGLSVPRAVVRLRQEGDTYRAGSYCEWMAYQKGQAAKTEQLEAAIAAVRPPVVPTATADPPHEPEDIAAHEQPAGH